MITRKWTTLTRDCNKSVAIVDEHGRLSGENDSTWLARCYKTFAELGAIVPERRVRTAEDFEEPNELCRGDTVPRPPGKPRPSKSKKLDSSRSTRSSSTGGEAFKEMVQEELRIERPYQPTTVTIPAVPATADSLTVPERTTVKTIFTMSPENKAHYESEREAIHLLLTGIGDEIYSTVDAYKTTHEMWIAIERLQQGEYLNIQDVKTNLFWVFRKFTSHDGESMESYYSIFYKMMNEMIRNNLTVATMQVNYQKEVNEICTERIAKNANPLALVATASPYPDPYYQAPTSHKPYTPTSKQSSSTRSNSSTKFKGKEIAKPITPPSESASKEDNTTPRYKNDNQTGQFGNQRTITVVGARETVGSQQSDWLAVTDKEIDEQELEAHYSFMAKIKEVLTADSGTDTEPLEQTDQNAEDERDALANLIANLKLDVDENKKIQKQLKKANASLAHELKECKSILAKTSRTLGESNSIWDSCLIALQNKQTEFESYKTLNDRTIDYDKLEHKLNETLGLLAQQEIVIKEGLKLKAYEISVVKEKHDELVKQSLLTKSYYEGLVKEKTKVITDLKLKKEKDIDKIISMEKQLKFLNEIVYKKNQSIQTIHMLVPKGPTFNGKPTIANPMYLKKAQSDPANRLVPDREETLTLKKESRSKLNKDLVRPYDYTKLNSLYEIFKPASQEYHEQLAHANENDSFTFVHELKQEMHADLKYVESFENEIDELESDKAEFSNMSHNELQCLYLHKVKECECLAQKLSKQSESVSKEVYTELLRSFAKLEKHSISLELALQQCQEQMKNDTDPICQIFHRPLILLQIVQLILFIVDSGYIKHMMGKLTLLCNFVEKYLGTVRFGNDQFAQILGYEDLVQGNITVNMVYYVKGLNHNLFSVGQFCDADLEVAFRKSTYFVRDLQGNDLLTGCAVVRQRGRWWCYCGGSEGDVGGGGRWRGVMMAAAMTYTAEPKNIKEAMADSAWIEAMQEELHQFDRLQVPLNMGCSGIRGFCFELTAFSDVDHAGCVDTRKSTSRGIQFLGDKLVSWMSKKQDCTAMSSAEAEYVALSASSLPTQALPLLALSKDRFKYLVRRIGMRCLTPTELEVLTKESA
ncbi:hypothetical protein Tco_0926067 [Tanacetum coccineum]|uniref:Retrovirus-related Pol polyprotein from transposon TNT 1-94-like beta-barrel domain-containing protein n=1 Tax=Tanacetum coccineum TaxID=301880 RepID=A0ABQ5D9I3_9ASTR